MIKPKNFFEAGKPYFFNQSGKVKRGILHYCELCGAPCCVNAVTITQAPSKIIARSYNSDMDECEELFYNGGTDTHTCLDCHTCLDD